MSSQPTTQVENSSSTEESRLVTADDLLSLSDDGKRYELIEGVLHMMSPAGFEHGRVAARIASLLDAHVRETSLGAVCGAETGFVVSRNPDTVRAPDAAFVAWSKLERIGETDRYLDVPPDLAVEVVSPNDRFSAVETKARMWLDAGTRLVLLVIPSNRRVHVLRSPSQVMILTEQDILEADDVVPGWRVLVKEFFA